MCLVLSVRLLSFGYQQELSVTLSYPQSRPYHSLSPLTSLHNVTETLFMVCTDIAETYLQPDYLVIIIPVYLLRLKTDISLRHMCFES